MLREEKGSVEPNTRDILTMCSVFPTHSHCSSCLITHHWLYLHDARSLVLHPQTSSGVLREKVSDFNWLLFLLSGQTATEVFSAGAACDGPLITRLCSLCCCQGNIVERNAAVLMFSLGKRRKLSRLTASLRSGGGAERRACWILEVNVCVTADQLLTSLILYV